MNRKEFIARLGRVAMLAMAGWACAQSQASADPPAADLIIRNGRIYTVDAQDSWAQAFAVRDGRFVAVGDTARIDAMAGPKTRIIDLKGAMVMPGINDVHVHPLDGAYEDLYACNFAPDSKLPQILTRVADCAAHAAPGDWITGGAWSSNLLAEMSTPAALQALDQASAGHPVLLRDDTFHNRWANSVAMRLGEVTAATQNPPGGVIVRDAVTGVPVGLFKEFSSFLSIEQKIPPRTPERMLNAARAAARTLVGYGITGAQDAFSTESILAAWHCLDLSEGLPLRMESSMSAMPYTNPQDRTGLDLVAVREQYRSANLQPDFAKLFLDGVPPARTSDFIDPYLPDHDHGHDYHGKSNYTYEQLVTLLTAYDKRGIAVKMHATGDGSVRLALDAIAEVRRRNGLPGARHQIAHVSFVKDSDIARFAPLNVTADISPMLWFPTPLGQAIAMAIGQQRAEHIFPIRKLLQAGVLVAGGSDWPAGQPTPNPWIGIEGLVTRRNPLGEMPGTLWPEQAVALKEALRIYTINSAMAMGIAARTGSIEAGKSADFIVLDRNLFTVPIEEVHKVIVRKTFYQGSEVHTATD